MVESSSPSPVIIDTTKYKHTAVLMAAALGSRLLCGQRCEIVQKEGEWTRV